MRFLRGVVAIGLGFLAAVLCWGSALLIGNHVFEWNPDKVSLEWQATTLFAVVWGVLGLLIAVAAARGFTRRGRALLIGFIVASVVAAWLFIIVEFARAEPAYLWVLIGVPVLGSMFGLRLRNAACRWWYSRSTPGRT